MPLLFHRQICFIHIPKTGGTSIEQVLCDHFPEDFALFWADERFQRKLDRPVHPNPVLHTQFTRQAQEIGLLGKCSPQHYTYSDIKKLCPDLDRWFSFTFIRHPWERVFSEWKYATQITQTETLDFGDFIDQIEERLRESPYARNNHYRPQADFISPTVRLYRYENYADQVRQLFGELGITEKTLPHIYKATEKGEYRKFYDSKLISRVEDLYHRDVAAFGYRF